MLLGEMCALSLMVTIFLNGKYMEFFRSNWFCICIILINLEMIIIFCNTW